MAGPGPLGGTLLGLADRRQLVLPAHCLKSDVTELPSHKVSRQIQLWNARWLASAVSKTRRNASANSMWASIFPEPSALLIPAVVRAKGHYVNRFVRGFLPPARWRFSPTCFGPSRLRMRRIIRTQVVAPAIQSAPVATHSVATIAHLAFSLAGTILIPDCAPPHAPFAHALPATPAGSYSQ